MKFTICGFSQRRLIELKLDLIDALILRYFIDFKDSGKMETDIFDDEIYYWIRYDKVVEEIPIIGITKNNNMYRRFKKLVDANVLKHRTKRKGGTFSYFRPGKEYYSLISEGSASKGGGGTSKKAKGSAPKGGTNNPSTKDSSKIHIEQSEKLWKLYPLKKGKAKVIKKIPQLIEEYSYEQMKRCVNRYIQYVEYERKKNFNLNYQNGSTFFNGTYVDYLDANYQEINAQYVGTTNETKHPSSQKVEEIFNRRSD